MNEYKLGNDNNVFQWTTGGWHTSIPMSEDNSDYRTFIKWVNAGSIPDPADPVPVVEPVPTNEERLAALEATQKTVTDKLIAAELLTKDDITLPVIAVGVEKELIK